MLTLVAATESSVAVAVGSGLPLMLTAALLLEAVVVGLIGLYRFFVAPREPDRVSPRILAGFALGWVGWCVSLAFAPTIEAAAWGLALNILWVVGSIVVILVTRERTARYPAPHGPQASAP